MPYVITYRTAGPWGSGALSDLAAETIDGSLYSIDQRVAALEGSPPVAVSIDDFDVANGLMTVVMTDASTRGPFALPVVSMRWKGAYVAGTTYLVNDVFTDSGRMFLVRVSHVAPATFDPSLFSGSGFVYTEMLERLPQTYDINAWIPDVGSYDARIMFQHVAARDYSILPLFENSVAFLRMAVSVSPLTYNIYRNQELIGMLDFAVGTNMEPGGTGQFGEFVPVSSPGEKIFMLRGDRLVFEGPQLLDPSAAGLSLTIAGLIEGSAVV